MFWPPENVTFFHSKLLLYNCKFHNIKDESTLSLHRSCICCRWRCYLYHTYVWSAPKQTVSSNQLAAPLDLSYHDPRQNSKTLVPAGDPPSTILIDGVPVEGVDEFIYIGSKQRSNGCQPDELLRTIVQLIACSVMNSLQSCSSLSMSTKIHLYQALIRSVLLYPWSPTWKHWRLSTWDVSDRYSIYAGGLMSPMQRCFSDLVCQPLVTSYVSDAYFWPCCMLVP